MADYTVANTKHATLAANVLDRITFTGLNTGHVVLENRSAQEFYFTFDFNTGVFADATVEGDDTFVCRGNSTCEFQFSQAVVAATLIAATAVSYSIEALP